MLTQTVTITQNSTPNIIIGRRGTYETEQVVFDVSWLIDTYGAGSAVLMVHRPTDQTAYPVDVVLDGNTLAWTVSETDTQYKGHGECEIFWYVNDGLAKTCICGITILRDIGDTTETAPDPYETWVETLSRLGAETLTNAQAAAESAGNAAASATGALQSATDAGNAKNAAVAAAEAAAASVSHYPQIVGGVWYVWSPTAGEYISTGIDAQGEDGVSPTVEITAIQGGHRVVITDAEGPHTFDVLDGVTPDMSAYRTAADQDEIDDAQDEQIDDLKSALNTKAGILRDTVSGSVASFVPDASVENLLGLTVDIEPVQAGSGDPSPDNVRPISGRDSVTVNANGTTHTIPLPETVYGGTLDVTAGKLTVDRAYKLLNDADKWVASTGTTAYRYIEAISRKFYDNSFTGLSCTIAPTNSGANYSARWAGATAYYFGIADTATTPVTSLDAIKAMATAGQIAICYAIEPVEITLTPTQIATIANQTNNVWADAGDVTVEFAADLKTYIDSKIAAAFAALS